MSRSVEEARYVLLSYSESEFYGGRVKRFLEKGPVEVVAIDYEKPQPFCLEISKDGSWTIVVNERRLPPPAAAWVRNKARFPTRVASERDVARKLALTEWAEFGGGLAYLLGHRLLNPIGHTYHKISQHHKALQAGFSVPPSAYFMGKRHALRALDEWGSVVLKPLGNPNIARFDHDILESHALSTVLVSVDTVSNAAEEEFLASPIWFQKLIGKGYELRIVVLGEAIYQSKIEGDIEGRKHVDSRAETRHFIPMPVLEPALESAIRRYMNLASLDYGVFDILVSDGHYWFLECNPHGQWESAIPFGLDGVIESAGKMILNKVFGSLPKT